MPTADAGPIRPLFGEDPARLAQCLQGRDDLVPILVPLEMLAVPPSPVLPLPLRKGLDVADSYTEAICLPVC